jgi:hypothetical protein
MRNLHRPRSHAPDAPTERRIPQNRRPTATDPRLQLIADGVVAGYIHDISARHGGVAEPRLRRQRGDQQ